MADVVQWSIDEFLGNLQNLQSQIQQVDDTLKADAAQLGQMYATARANYDPSRDAFIAPAIHSNNDLRITYLQPIKNKFNEAVSAARSAIQAAGYTVPGQLGDLGILPLVPIVAIAAVLVAFAAVAIVYRLTQSQVSRTATLASIYADKGMTFDQKQAAVAALQKQAADDRRANPPLFDWTAIMPALALVALIVLGPPILKMLPQGRKARRAAA